jgi:hypothetical protein
MVASTQPGQCGRPPSPSNMQKPPRVYFSRYSPGVKSGHLAHAGPPSTRWCPGLKLNPCSFGYSIGGIFGLAPTIRGRNPKAQFFAWLISRGHRNGCERRHRAGVREAICSRGRQSSRRRSAQNGAGFSCARDRRRGRRRPRACRRRERRGLRQRAGRACRAELWPP